MAKIDGNKAANEFMLDAAKLAAAATLYAPKLANAEIKTGIFTNEDVLPIAELLGIIGEGNSFVYGDSVCIKKAYEKGCPPVILLVGTNTLVSDLAWNCGACGFDTCAEFNKYSSDKKSAGAFYVGPSCNWKYFDLSMSICWAAAALADLNVENRVQDSVGFAAFNLGYLEGCNTVTGIVIGPARGNYYYDRPELANSFDFKEHEEFVMTCLPQFYMSFCGGGHPVVKNKPDFFVNPLSLKPVDDKDFAAKQQDILRRVVEYIEKYKKDVQK